jgi:hypothetical protein
VWWEKPFVNIPLHAYSRRELILDIADKQAVHVDTAISEKFKAILESKLLNITFDNKKVEPINIARILVGRIGVEMLTFLEKHFPQ